MHRIIHLTCKCLNNNPLFKHISGSPFLRGKSILNCGSVYLSFYWNFDNSLFSWCNKIHFTNLKYKNQHITITFSHTFPYRKFPVFSEDHLFLNHPSTPRVSQCKGIIPNTWLKEETTGMLKWHSQNELGCASWYPVTHVSYTESYGYIPLV